MSDEMPSNARFRQHEATLSSDGNTVQLMADYMSSGYDPILFNSPSRGLQSAFTMDIEDVLRLDVHSFQLPQFESNDRMNQILPTSHRQAEMMIPDSQSCMPSSTASSGGYTDHIKMEVMPLNNPMSSTTSSSTAVPSSIPYTGEYGFEIAFEQQNKETKSINWTYSEMLNKLYVRMEALVRSAEQLVVLRTVASFVPLLST